MALNPLCHLLSPAEAYVAIFVIEQLIHHHPETAKVTAPAHLRCALDLAGHESTSYP